MPIFGTNFFKTVPLYHILKIVFFFSSFLKISHYPFLETNNELKKVVSLRSSWEAALVGFHVFGYFRNTS